MPKASNVIRFQRPPEPEDPILALLRRYKEIWQQFHVLAEAEDAIIQARRNPSRLTTGLPDKAELEARDEELKRELDRVEEELCETEPTTIEGCFAVLEVLVDDAAIDQLGASYWHGVAIENALDRLRELRA